MFKFLKEKLKNWTQGLKKEEREKEEVIESKIIEASKEKPSKKDTKTQESPIIQKVPEPQEDAVIRDVKEAKHELTSEIDHHKKENKFAQPSKEIKKDVEQIIEQVQKVEEKKGLFSKLKEKVSSTTISEQEFEEQFGNLEQVLLENNVALEVVDEIKKSLKTQLLGKIIQKKEFDTVVKNALKESIEKILLEPINLIEKIKSSNKPFIILFFGINGTGKTTTIAKLAYLLKENKISSVIAAADTFRAASIEQLESHGKKLDIKIIKHDYGSDPASIAFDAIKYSKSHNIDVVLIDTAGRMHTKTNLLKEMEKISRIANPDLKILIAESIAGNDAVEQARHFSESVGLDGSILTKADVDEKGGTILSIGYVTKKPILFLGTGQNYKDLEQFNKNKFLEKLGL